MKKICSAILGAIVIAFAFTTQGVDALTCTPSTNTFQGDYTLKLNGVVQGTYVGNVTIETESDCRTNLVGGSVEDGLLGSFDIDTTDEFAWKNNKIAVNTWKSTLIDATLDSSALYLNGDYRQFNGNTTANFKVYSGGTKASIKIAGTANNGITNVSFEIESTTAGFSLQ
jgi:hypothetical protein